MAHDVNQSEMEVATQVRTALVARISHERYDLWMPGDCRWQYSSGTLTLLMPNEFSRMIAKRMLNQELRLVLDQVVGENAILSWEVVSDADDEAFVATVPVADPLGPTESSCVTPTADPIEHSVTMTAVLPEVKKPRSLTNGSPTQSSTVHSSTVHSSTEQPTDTETRYRSDHWSEFIAGSSNLTAWSTINMVANEPGKMTPLLLHGPHGVGKSHLATALAQRLRTQKRLRRVLHITAEQFTNDFTEAIRGSGLPMMRRKYRDVDALILDDLQFLANKKATVAELRHTMDNLLKLNRQVVFMSDRPLNDLEELGAEFVGRLRGGLPLPLLPLDEETRYQILKRDLKLCEVELSDEMTSQIAARAIGDGRLIKGIVKRLMATSYINEHPLTWDECWNAIFDLIQATQPIVRLGDIERVVCEVFGLEPESLQSDRKTRQVSQPRMLAMFLARKYTPAAYQEIGEYFGNRRHSTVISAEKTVSGWLADNAKLQLPRGPLTIRDALRHVEANLHVG